MKFFLSILLLSTSLFAGDFEKGLAYLNEGYCGRSIKHFKIVAQQGDMVAQHNLAWTLSQDSGNCGMYYNPKEAVKWYRLSANQGYDLAQLNLGYMYHLGKGVLANKIKAYEWYRKAAYQGNAIAQKNLDKLCRQSPWACK